MKMTVYGIKSCDTMKKAFNWLHDHGIAYQFHDYRADGITADRVEKWLKKLPVTEVINTRSTTFKELSAAQQKSISDPGKAAALILSNPTMVKRPLVEIGSAIVTGFKPEAWQEILGK